MEDKVFLVGDAQGKKVRSFKADMKTNFENVNFKDENNVEEYGDDDCRRKIIPLEEDIVWYYPTLVDITSYLASPFMWVWFMLTECWKRTHLPARNNSLFFVCAVCAVGKGKDWLVGDGGTICQFFSYGCILKDGGETCWHWISFAKREHNVSRKLVWYVVSFSFQSGIHWGCTKVTMAVCHWFKRKWMKSSLFFENSWYYLEGFGLASLTRCYLLVRG